MSIKKWFFSQENIDYIIKILKTNIYNKYQIDNDKFFQKSDIYKMQYKMFELFNSNSSNKNLSDEDIIITLNQMTISQYEILIESLLAHREQEKSQQNINININNTRENKYLKIQETKQQLLEQQQLLQQENVSNVNSAKTTRNEQLLQQENEEKKEKNEEKIKEEKVSAANSAKLTRDEEEKNIIHLFSSDCKFTDFSYTYSLFNKPIKSLKLLNFTLYNNLYNITDDNNKFDVEINSYKKTVILPSGNYNLETLLKICETNLNFENSEFKLTFDQIKNRITISNNLNFNIRFIEKNNVVSLKSILGFNNFEYKNNNKYISNFDPYLNIYDDIYIKINLAGKDLNKYKTSTLINNNKEDCFSYFTTISFNCLKSFSQNIYLNINEEFTIHSNLANTLLIDFYYRNINDSTFYKIKQKLIFNTIILI